MQSKIQEDLEVYLVAALQDAMDRMVNNLYTGVDSKGRNRAASKQLAQSITVTPSVSGGKLSTSISMNDYWEFVDKGVKGMKSTHIRSKASPFTQRKKPPIAKIREWMRFRGIVGKTSRVSRKRDSSPLERIAHAIATNIMKHGTEAFPFYSSVITVEWQKQLVDDIARVSKEGLGKDIDAVINRMVTKLQSTGVSVSYKP